MTRIIAGSRGGRRLVAPSGGRTRPTTDRVREALFSAVATWAGDATAPAERSLAGHAFCDLYAGSGAVGLEAASRGAAPVMLVEADRRTAEVARRNAAELGLRPQVRVGRVEAVVAEPPPQPFDVVFADPPYEVATPAVEAVVARLLQQGWLAPDGLVVVERSRRSDDLRWPDAVSGAWERRYGETTLWFGSLPQERP